MPLYGDPTKYMTWRTVKYADVDGSPEGNFYFDRGMITRSIHVAWEQKDLAVVAFMGGVSVINGAGGNRTLSRLIPHSFPTYPWMYVQGVQNIKPIGMTGASEYPPSATDAPTDIRNVDGNLDDGTGVARYRMAEISLQYVMPTFKIKEDAEIIQTEDMAPLQGLPDEGQAIANGYSESRYITRHIKPQGKMLTIPRGLLKGPDLKPILEAVAVNEFVSTFEYTWHQVPEEALPELTWLEGQNSVNHDWFDNRPPGTLLFCGDPEVRPEPNPITGQMLHTVKYQFHSLLILDPSVAGPPSTPGRLKGHNYIRKPVGGTLAAWLFSTDGVGTLEGTRIFPDFDFRKLFRPDPLTP